MPTLTIDNRRVTVPEGATVLDAARALGIDVPALCFREGCTPSTSCLACVVRIDGGVQLVPSCATPAAEGMRVESETDEVRQVRRTALELLLSDHLGDCAAPCQFGCPAGMDIPTMLRQIVAGRWPEAIATVKRDIALPAVLGRICPAPCEKVCRRGDGDCPDFRVSENGTVPLGPSGSPVSICRLKQLVADVDLASPQPYTPECKPASGKRVAIVGAGPTGLSAAYYLGQFGHACELFDDNPLPGGRLWIETSEEKLPREVLAAEVAVIQRLGVVMHLGTHVPAGSGVGNLRDRFDAVLVACGAVGPVCRTGSSGAALPESRPADGTHTEQAAGWGLPTSLRGIQVKTHTYETGLSGVFAAGSAVRGKTLVVRSVADGKEAAIAISQFLRGEPVTGQQMPLSVHIGRMQGEELQRFADTAVLGSAAVPAAEDGQDARAPAARCLHCDCRGATSCKLRKYAAAYGAHPRRFKAARREFQCDARHADVIYEPGKCIDCGLCIQIAAAAGEPLGLTFVGRGFDVRVAVPLDRSLADALTKAAADCVAACPTAALAWMAD
jgi:NADPH-dependent glutamate synthase beta subunit-like oxidoreductase